MLQYLLKLARTPHRNGGYAVVHALAVRLVWGFFGCKHTRFSDFLPGPRRFMHFVRLLIVHWEPRYIEHNPAGALMILALMALLAFVSITGWMLETDRFWGVGWVEQVHETALNAIIITAVVHVAGALIESVRHRENLVWSMVTGCKRASVETDVGHASAADRG